LRDQPPSDGEADIAFACSQSSPGPSLNLEWNKITKIRTPDPLHLIDVVGVPSFRIWHPVTTDSIALGGDSLTWGAFGWIRCALLVTVRGDRSASPRMVLLTARTTNCELHVHGQTIETPMNPMRVWREIRLQVAESHLSFDACILSAAGGIGVRGMRDRRQLEASRQRFQIVPGKGTKIHAGLALSVSSQELQATTVFAGR
jgi:hypothetical protein